MLLSLLGKFAIGLVLGLGGIGSCLGIVAAGTAAAAAWSAEGKEGKTPSARYILFVAAPLSQTFYAMIMMKYMAEIVHHPENSLTLFGFGLTCGIVELVSAMFQGQIGAAGIRCLNANGGKGFGNIILALGIIESVGLFAMVFTLYVITNPAFVVMGKAAAAAAGAN
jgi:V/A-type H+-transporting ATPase subunit K